jgi:sulfate transport system permease protein
MAGSASTLASKSASSKRRVTSESPIVKTILVLIVVAYCSLFLLFPLGSVFYEAFKSGWAGYKAALLDPDSIFSMKMTLMTVAISVPLNVIFGVAAAWAIAKFNFKGKNVLVTLIDLPFSVSPVIAGLVFVLLFGRLGIFHAFLVAHNIKIVYAFPGIALATTFVTVPFVARELIPIMEAQGIEEEQAAMVLGASGWQIFWRVTIPNVKWGLLYGVILCNARAMGEFGAVNVVSGVIAGVSCTMPLQIQLFYESQENIAAFSLSSLLSMLAIITLIVKNIVEWLSRKQLSETIEPHAIH